MFKSWKQRTDISKLENYPAGHRLECEHTTAKTAAWHINLIYNFRFEMGTDLHVMFEVEPQAK